MADSNTPEPPIDPESVDWLTRVRMALGQLQREGQTMTYLEFADHLGLTGPHKIHRLTELLEATMAEDASLNRIPRASRVVSRARAGLPAPGFFAHARDLGIMGPEPDHAIYAQWRASLDRERQT